MCIGLQMQKNLFDTPYAHALLAMSGSPDQPGEAIGLALYFFNFSTWTGRPGLFVSTWEIGFQVVITPGMFPFNS